MPRLITSGAISARALGFGKRASPNVWDPAKTSPDLVIGGAGVTLTRSGVMPGGWRTSLALVPITGVVTFTNLCTFADSGNAGVGNVSTDLSSFLGADGNSLGVSMVDGEVYYAGGSIGNLGWSYSSGDSISTQTDLPNNRIRFNKNGGAYSTYFSLSGLTGIFPGSGLFRNGDTVATTF